jgi:ribosomal protein L11 methyltransferase
MRYCRISLITTDEELRGRLIAHLTEAGFEAFEEADEALIAFISEESRHLVKLEDILSGGPEWSEEVVEQQNWNALWESSFDPVLVPGFCIVRASFHEPDPSVPHEVIITPKMSFGTGHHATTRLMIQAMRDIDFNGKRVLDFGTGTGILAILAAKLGAVDVLGVDNDSWSIENAEENAQSNQISGLQLKLGSLEAGGSEPYHVILANINRHILLQYMEQMRNLLFRDATLLLSGILKDDEEIITKSALKAGLTAVSKRAEGDWLCLRFDNPKS